MKRTFYFIVMSFLGSIIVSSIVVDVVNMTYPDFGLDYELAIGFFFALIWAVLSLCGLILYRSKPSDSNPS